MKKKKYNIMLSIATLCLCVAVLAFGVYAAKKASLTTTGSINFEAHNCKIRVLGSVTGAVDSTGATATVNKLKDTENDSDGNEQGKLITGDVTWAVGDLYFDDLNCSNDEIATPIVFTFVMTNESDYPVTADLNLTGDLSTKIDSNIESSSSTDLTKLSNGCVLIKNQVATVTLILLPKTEDSLAINLNNLLKLKFEKVAEESSFTNLTFTKDETTKTASVKAANKSITSAIIPEVFLSDGDVYFVTEMKYSEWNHSGGFFECSSLVNVSIPNSITSIDNYVFKGCTSLTSITIPESVTSIGQYAFYYCSNLTSIIIPDSVTSIGTAAFNGCTNLETVVMSNNIQSFGGSELRDTKYITNYSTNHPGENLIYLYNNNNEPVALYGYVNKDEVTGEITNLPNTLKCICSSLFYGCTNLTSITIPDNVTSIGGSAFSGCTGLTSITISSSVTSIGGSAFSGCTNSELTSITYLGTMAQWNAISLNTDWKSDNITKVVCTDGTITL